MATIMTKQGNLDNVVTYEHFCDTVTDLQNIDPHYVTLGSTCIVVNGENGGLEVYIADSNKEWRMLSINSGESGGDVGIGIHICGNDEYDAITRIPTVSEPVENTFYLVPSTGLDSLNLFEEWIYIDDNWEKFGGGSIEVPEQIQVDWNINDVNSKAYIKNKPTIPTVDSSLSTTSENPVQNKAITDALNYKIEKTKIYNGLDKDDEGFVLDARQGKILNEMILQRPIKKIYGFHIDSSESDPYACVTYIADASGMSPAMMDYTNNVFNWGSWSKNEFFMPRPCMLKYDGTVDYYLDADDYSKKEDGTPSDVSNFDYNGNAMMEWGRDGKIIWYKIVPDINDNTSASVYVADYKVDNDYQCWSFINNQGEQVGHFYTSIYNGTLDAQGRLRSISNKTYDELCQDLDVLGEIAAAELNNTSSNNIWYTSLFSDVTLIKILLILIGKSIDTQTTFGNGRINQTSSAEYMIGTGTMDTKGMFWGASTDDYGVKVFGMENYWGNQWNRIAGNVMINGVWKYKMTYPYNINGDNYVVGNMADTISTHAYISKCSFNKECFLAKEFDGNSSTYWCDSVNNTDNMDSLPRDVVVGGACSRGKHSGAFCCSPSNRPTLKSWAIGTSLSCKPQKEDD